MEPELEHRLRALEDREAIRELCARYCTLVDDESFDELVQRCFTADARCDFRSKDGTVGPLLACGADELRLFFGQAVPGLLREMHHTMHNHGIVLDGDAATGCSDFELTALAAAGGEAVVGAGRYLDRYRRDGGVWLLQERTALLAYIAPLAEGWARRRFIPALSADGSAIAR